MNALFPPVSDFFKTDTESRRNPRSPRSRSSGGRWSLLTSSIERIDPEAFARRLLARWGVVFRDVVADRKSLAPPWRETLVALRSLEARGESRGGRFIAGYVGEQYALPDAIEALRAARRSADAGDIVEIGAYDPLALAKSLMPGAPPRPLRAAVS